MSEKVSVRARFEKFPATVKGAFILRGEDRDPHQVIFGETRAVALGGDVRRPVPIAAVALDVAPKVDVFVPFELSVADLEPGWYGFECDLDVDGIAGTYPGGRRFAVAWPRATVRRGPVNVDRRVDLGGETHVHVGQVECGGDSIRLSLTVAPPGPLTVRLFADDARLEVLESEADEDSGRIRVLAYPLMKTHRTLRVELKGKGRGAEGALDVRLP